MSYAEEHSEFPEDYGFNDPPMAVEIGHAFIGRHRVSWMNNGVIYLSRALWDMCGQPDKLSANTSGQFTKICATLNEKRITYLAKEISTGDGKELSGDAIYRFAEAVERDMQS